MSLLQTGDLAMLGLGIKGDVPPNDLQPPLPSGIHLRWSFQRSLGFPWWGFYLLRRPHREDKPICLSHMGADLERVSGQLSVTTSSVRISSDAPMALASHLSGLGLDLSGRSYLRFEFPGHDPSRRATCTIDFVADDAVTVQTFADSALLMEQKIEGCRGETVSAAFDLDRITAIVFTGAAAILSDFCWYPVQVGARFDWEPIPGLMQQIALPARNRGYPADGRQPDAAASARDALDRIRYGPPADWADQPFKELHEQLQLLVRGGPAAGDMADRTVTEPGEPELSQRPLDTALFAALHPAVAQMLGLYYVDSNVESERGYDYLIVGDFLGRIKPGIYSVLDEIRNNGFVNLHGYICYNLQVGKASPVLAPIGVNAVALPGPGDGTCTAGLTWQQVASEPAGRPVFIHAWRADLGKDEPRVETEAKRHCLVTGSSPVLVGAGGSPAGFDGWPPYPVPFVERVSPGWYSYRVSSIDIFGRHSTWSDCASWHQWQPAPEPRPWYYIDPPGDRMVHPHAVRLVDRTPPPAPIAEAWCIDERDPLLVRDRAVDEWLSTAGANRIALRVKWSWSPDQTRARPVREFRIYYHRGTDAPEQSAVATNWDLRLHVVDAADFVADHQGELSYDVFIPVTPDLDLEPDRDRPVVYGQVGVSAADEDRETDDDPRWSGTAWGGRHGNEGAVSQPCRVYRVHRDPPPPPEMPDAGERVWATPADYHGHSFHTVRVPALPGLKVHVLRALDHTLFTVDREQRAGRAIDPGADSLFPSGGRWSHALKAQVAAEINALSGLAGDELAAGYRDLSDDALRVLGGLPGNETAFAQVTIDAIDRSTHPDLRGPDDDDSYVPRTNLCAFTDTLPGTGSNRYLYRAIYVDAAHNRSQPGLASTPVSLPPVLPPPVPVLSSITPGNCVLTFRWTRVPDATTYRIYRTDKQDMARDIRLMTLVHELVAGSDDPEWTDSVPGLVTFYYRLVAVDAAGNCSRPTPAIPARAVDDSLPAIPALTAVTGTDGLTVLNWTSGDETRVQSRDEDQPVWADITDWLPAGDRQVTDEVPLTTDREYRLLVRKYTGAQARGEPVTVAGPEGDDDA